MGSLSAGTNGRFVHPKHPWVSNQEAGELMGREAINRSPHRIGFRNADALYQEPHDGLSWMLEFRVGHPWHGMGTVYKYDTLEATTPPSRCLDFVHICFPSSIHPFCPTRHADPYHVTNLSTKYLLLTLSKEQGQT